MSDFLSGFDDFMERQEPGYRQRRAEEKAQREHARLRRREAIIQRYGSADAALAPCEREALLHQALSRWIVYSKPPHHRWTYSVEGWSGLSSDLPAHLREAVQAAYPMPTTFREAKAEYDYWRAREQEMEDVLGECGDSGLDRPARMRLDLLWDLVNTDIPAASWEDVRDRLQFHIDRDFNDVRATEALLRDVNALLNTEPRFKIEIGAPPALLGRSR